MEHEEDRAALARRCDSLEWRLTCAERERDDAIRRCGELEAEIVAAKAASDNMLDILMGRKPLL